jgi:hypothetical protein
MYPSLSLPSTTTAPSPSKPHKYGRDIYNTEIVIFKILSAISMTFLFINSLTQLMLHGLNLYRNVLGPSTIFAIVHLIQLFVQIFIMLLTIQIVFNIIEWKDMKKACNWYLFLNWLCFGVVSLFVWGSVIVLVLLKEKDPAWPGDVKAVSTAFITNWVFYLAHTAFLMTLMYYIQADPDDERAVKYYVPGNMQFYSQKNEPSVKQNVQYVMLMPMQN